MKNDAPRKTALPVGGAGDVTLSQPNTASLQRTIAPSPVPDHELIRCIGRGAYGEVWLARHARLGTLRAVKIVRRDHFDDARPFQRECDGIRRYEPISRGHPHLVAILHVGGTDDCFFYMMELADRQEKSEVGSQKSEAEEQPSDHRPLTSDLSSYFPHTLRSELKRHGALPIDRCLEIALALAGALAHLHARGLVHRDVKPSNVIFVGTVAKLADIGLVAAVSDSRSFVGTEGYIPPEGPGSPSADCYALGKLLYELSTGHDRTAWPEPPADLPTRPDRERLLELNAILHKACTPDTRARYQSAETMLLELELLRQGVSVKRKRTVQRRVAFTSNFGVVAVVFGLLFAVVGFLSSRNLEQKRIHRKEAEKVYQAGRRSVNTQTKDGFTHAVDLFHQAIAIDPNYTPAYVGLADAHFSASGWDRPPREAMPMARWASLKALEIDDSSAEAHVWLARVKFQYDWDWAGAEAQFKRAIQVQAKSGTAHECYAMFLASIGRPNDARTEMELSEPLVQLTDRVCYSYGLLFYFDRQYDKAIEQAFKGLALDTNSALNHLLLTDCYMMKGMYPEAIGEAQKLQSLDDSPSVVAELGYLYAAIGQTNEARKRLAQLEHDSTTRHVSAYFRGFIHLGLGEKDKALDCLEQAYEERFGWMANLKAEPVWDGLRGEPRFYALLMRMGLEK